MRKRFQYIIVLTVMLLSITHGMAQVAMPDTVCVGTARVYQVNDANISATYTWKIGGVVQASAKNSVSVNWSVAGTFLLSVQEHSAGGCDGDVRTGVVHVMAPPIANAGPDTVVCFGTPVRLSGSGGSVYQWSPAAYLSNAGIASPVAALPFAGNYQYILTISNSNACSLVAHDTVVITVLQPVKVFAGADTSIAIGEPLQLDGIDINNAGLIKYAWSPAFGLNNAFIKNPVAILNSNASYTLIAQTAKGCTARDDINITVFVKPDLYVPNAFTPNADGKNDIFKPIPIGIKEIKYFAIYNRYGELVFKTTVQGAGWDGTVKGIRQNTGAFIWMAEAVDFKGNIITKKGTVVLVK